MAAPRNYTAIMIGTSAGGLYALSAILEKLPPGFPIPLIVVQHRSREPRDLLEEILQTKCKIRIKQADEKERMEKGFVYIAPPDYHLLIEHDKTFSLSCDEPVRYSRPSIDVLFETGAHVFKKDTAGIILTGANDDGAAGIVAVRKEGGLTIAQRPDEAQFSFMPEAAIRTNAIQHIWSLSEITGFLLKIHDEQAKKAG